MTDLERALASVDPGRRVEVHAALPSTQDRAFVLAEYGAPDGTIVAADVQTAGRGRRGRVWEAGPGEAVLLSMVLRPGPASPPPTVVVAATAAGIAAALDAAFGTALRLRWPNDLLAGGGKVAGVLIETRDFDARAPLYVLGCGLNVSAAPPGAVGLSAALAEPVARARVAEAVVAGLDAAREALAAGDVDAIAADFAARAAFLGERVTVQEGSTPHAGTLLAVHPVAGLRLRDDDGREHVLRAELARELRPAPAGGSEPAP